MSKVNKTQVQLTNDASAISKCSAARKNYFKDNFIEHFVGNKKSRTSLIHLGYYTRVVLLQNLVKNYIQYLQKKNIFKFQIVSCGSGFDTAYWRLSELKLLDKESTFVEIDFPSVIRRKSFLINQSQELTSYLKRTPTKHKNNKIHVLNSNYFLLEADLNDISTIEDLFDSIDINYNIPTLFLSECVITYMKVERSDLLINWMANKFSNGALINYEQIHPHDGFGVIMSRHFDKLQSSLFSLENYPNCASHNLRYKQLGFESNFAISEWEALLCLTTEYERQFAFSLELFDEFEEFHNKCVHYVVGVAGNQIASDWINSLPFNCPHLYNVFVCSHEGERKYFVLKSLESNLELYRHSSCLINNRYIYLFGGTTKQKRSSSILQIDCEGSLNFEKIEAPKMNNLQLDILYSNVVNFELDGSIFFCLFGGRTSPNKASNENALVIFQKLHNEMDLKLTIYEKDLTPRYRSAMVSLNLKSNEAQCWIFGGRSADSGKSLSDLWKLDIILNCDNTLNCRSKSYEEKINWPCGRISHSMVFCPKTFALYVTCGLIPESSIILNDIWKWCCKNQTWRKLSVTGALLPRYGHSSHLLNNIIYLVGGVNTFAGKQPNLAIINLNELRVMEFTLEPSCLHPVLLFNHTSVIIRKEKSDGGTQILILGGGGNCFSFGTYVNQGIQCLQLDQLKHVSGT